MAGKDRKTLVQPLQSFLRNDGSDLAAVCYGDWHHKKCLGILKCVNQYIWLILVVCRHDCIKGRSVAQMKHVHKNCEDKLGLQRR